MSSFDLRPYLLVNTIQHYAWGERGEQAFIPRLLGMPAQPDKTYAELWMGAHPSAPSQVILDGRQPPLHQLVRDHPDEILGPSLAPSNAFPFLLKVVSAAEALSIQAHPDRAQARLLHARDPQHYPDDNHKPEIAVALDSLAALVGFRSLPEILSVLDRYPELAGLVGRDEVSRLRASSAAPVADQESSLRAAFSSLMRRSPSGDSSLTQAIDHLVRRLGSSGSDRSEPESLFLQLSRQYPGDVGLFSVFLLNLLHLDPGQAVFLTPGTLHAYVKGNIVECMATSDNVVRAGLTGKFKDVEALLDILAYHMGSVPILGRSGPGDVEYPALVSEFRVSRMQLKPGDQRSESPGIGPAVLLITEGDVRVSWKDGQSSRVSDFGRGQSVLIPAGLSRFDLSSSTGAVVFRASVPAPSHARE